LSSFFIIITKYFLVLQNCWDNTKRITLRKVSESKQTGSGGSKLTRVDHVVLDIIGKESAHMAGLNLPDERPSFSGSIMSDSDVFIAGQENLDSSFSSVPGKIGLLPNLK
jgi:hypothetical protein